MDSLLDTAISGGPIVGVLILLSLLSLTVIGMKIIQLRGVLSGAASRRAAFDLWGKGDRRGAMAALQGGTSPADRLLSLAMAGLTAGRRRPSLEADLEWRGNAEIATLGRHIRLLELIAMISPLLGLLGTVLGMIQSFQELAAAEGAANASVLAAGIWEALLTTAAGLLVAIPAAVAATLLGGRVEAAAQTIEAAAGQLFAIEDGQT
ncbi:MAG: MotA/TolQ/ExbB proton channel family protein [Pseudomonadota bacterium]